MNPEDIREYAEEHARVLKSIKERYPALPDITAFVMAGDEMSRDRALQRIVSGELPFQQAVWLVGSYARMNFTMILLERGLITYDDIIPLLPELWRGSDPDDTDQRFLALWRLAWAENGNKYIRDGRPLPRFARVRVYRGQERGAPVGIAWSTDRNIAVKFARGAGLRVSNLDGVVLEGMVDRRKVLGYLTGRGENEVVVDPKDVRIAP